MASANSKRALVIAAALTVSAVVSSSPAATIYKANNTDALNLESSWTDGVAPGASDIATWDSSYTLTSNLTLGDDLSWSGIAFIGVPNGFTLNGGNTLTLGADGITTTINKNYTFNNGLILSAAQTWSIGSGITNFGTGTSGIETNGHALTFAGGGQKVVKTAISGGGDLLFSGGTSKFGSGSAAASSNATVGAGATLNFDVSSGTRVRLDSLTLMGGSNAATLSLTAASNGNQVDQIAGALSIAPGNSVVTITPNAGYNARIEAGSFDRQAGSNVLIRGTGLGSAAGAGVANVVFASAPSLAGNGTSGNTIGLLRGAVGDTASNGSGFGVTGGLVTYDAANGVRLLSSTEYQAGITDGQGYEATPVYVNASIENSSGALGTTTLDSNTAVNSLSLRVTAADSGITIGGAGSLKITSGIVYASQTVAAGATNAINIETPVDMNGQEAVILANTAGISNSTTTGRLEFKGAISNGNGLTKAGPGEVRFSGSAANSYSGTTTVNEGILTLSKSSGVNAIGGDLVINGGRVQHNLSNQIPDTANITINAGTYSLQYSNTGGVSKETYNNLTMNGGTYTTGTAGHSGESNILGTMTLNGGSINMSATDDVTVSGLATFSGGTQSISPSNSTTVYNTIVSFNGGLAINNTATGAYTPLTVQSHATNKGARLVLGGGLTFTGNTTNSETVTIAAGSLANLGYIDLNGAVRTFNIGDGAASDDLTVNPIIDNGGIDKTGAGTLVLDGSNTYTGNTTISGGVLALGATGSIATSPRIEITAGASFVTSAQSFAMLGSQTVAFGLDPAGAGSAGLLKAAALDISAAAVDFSALGTLDDSVYILATYTPDMMTGTQFASIANQPAGYSIDYAYNGNSIALVVPEPGTIALASMVAGMSLLARRRSVRA